VCFRNSANSSETYGASFNVGPYLLQSSGHNTVDMVKITDICGHNNGTGYLRTSHASGSSNSYGLAVVNI
jgi:hypothetical protein